MSKWFYVFTLAIWLQTHFALGATVIFSNDVLGDLEPCGCRSNPSGGLDRKAILIEKLSNRHKKESWIQVDTGDLLFDSIEIPELLKGQKRIQAKSLLKIYKILGHDLILPGEKDFALGLDALISLAKESQIRWISSNLVDRKTKKSVFDQQWTSKDGVLFIGILGTQFSKQSGFPKNLEILNPFTVVSEILTKNSMAKEIVILTHQGFEEDQKLARMIKQRPDQTIRIIGGHSQSFLQQPIIENHIPIGQSSFRNQAVGIWNLDPTKSELTYELKPLDEKLSPTLPGQEKFRTRKVREIEKIIKTTKDKIAKEAAHSISLSSKSIASHQPELQTWVRCMDCHQKQWEFWKSTRHANAWNSLFEKKDHQNLECLKCHTVGLGQKEGFHLPDDIIQPKTNGRVEFFKDFRSTTNEAEFLEKHNEIISKSKIFAPVQCENCHGSGNQHPFGEGLMIHSNLKQKDPKKVAESVCLKCHLYERAPNWYIDKGMGQKSLDPKTVIEKLKQVTCPKD